MLDSFYENIGGKIKNFAKWTFVVEAIGSVISGIGMLIDGDMLGIGIPLILFGPLVAFVSSWLLYGFGELIETNSDIRRKLYAKDTCEEERGKEFTSRFTEDLKRQALYTMRRITAKDLERAISLQIMRKVTISEMDCTLIYLLTKRGLPQEMHLELTVDKITFYSLDLMLFDKHKNAYSLDGERLTLDERWLPQDEIFDFDLSQFKSFKTLEETAQ